MILSDLSDDPEVLYVCLKKASGLFVGHDQVPGKLEDAITLNKMQWIHRITFSPSFDLLLEVKVDTEVVETTKPSKLFVLYSPDSNSYCGPDYKDVASISKAIVFNIDKGIPESINTKSGLIKLVNVKFKVGLI